MLGGCNINFGFLTDNRNRPNSLVATTSGDIPRDINVANINLLNMLVIPKILTGLSVSINI
jgi:hypothetical protein